MARAFVALYGATGDREWLNRAQEAVHFIGKNFAARNGAGFLTAKAPNQQDLSPLLQRDENVMVARTANLLFHYTGNSEYQDIAKTAMRYLAAKPVVDRLPASSALLADLEIGSEPLHLTIVGHKDDPAAQIFFLLRSAIPRITNGSSGGTFGRAGCLIQTSNIPSYHEPRPLSAQVTPAPRPSST